MRQLDDIIGSSFRYANVGGVILERSREIVLRVLIRYLACSDVWLFLCNSMVVLRDDTNTDPENSMSWEEMEGRIATMVGQEVARAFREELPGMLDAFRGNLMGTMDARITAALAADGGRGATDVRLRDFSSMRPPTFEGEKDPLVSQRWIHEMESAFFTAAIPAPARVRMATSTLRGAARDWWTGLSDTLTMPVRDALTWEHFSGEV